MVVVVVVEEEEKHDTSCARSLYGYTLYSKDACE